MIGNGGDGLGRGMWQKGEGRGMGKRGGGEG